MKLKVLITAGGRGTRLRPLTFTLNKHLIPVANRPMIFRVIDEIVKLGLKDIIINIRQGDKEIPAFIEKEKKKSWPNLKVKYVEQIQPLGLAHVVKIAQPLIGQNYFLFYLGDNILAGGIKKYLEEFKKSLPAAHLLLCRVRDPERFGVAKFNQKGQIIRLIEKPKRYVSDFALTGIYFFSPLIFEAVRKIKPSQRGELEITDAIQLLLKKGAEVRFSEVTGWWKDTGKPKDLLEGNQLLLSEIKSSEIKGKIDSDCFYEGKVQIGRGTRILAGTVIRGPVTIGENCLIEKSYLGPFTSVGNNVRISGTEIENSIIMDEAEVVCQNRIVDSLIGQKAKITPKQATFPLGHKLVIGDHSQVEL